MSLSSLPPKQGLYDPRNEHDSCGVGFVVDIKNRKNHDIVRQGLEILVNVTHRGAVGADPMAGDGAGEAEHVRVVGTRGQAELTDVGNKDADQDREEEPLHEGLAHRRRTARDHGHGADRTLVVLGGHLR